jgi:AcrR family transcriptional regulator
MMMAIQQRGQKTEAKIVQTALDLFHKQGIEATSVDEILERSGTGKSQFYHYFKSKDDLIHAVVKHFYAMLCDEQLPMKQHIRTWKDLEDWFDFFIQCQKSTCCARGCPMVTIGYHLMEKHESIRQDINLILQMTIKPIRAFFADLKARGKLRKSADPDSLADLCFITMQGGLIVSKIKKECTSFEKSVHHVLSYLKSFSVKT